MTVCKRSKQTHFISRYTVLPTKADHDVMVCLHLYQKFTFMTCICIHYIHQVVIAQVVAHRISNHLVLSSIPAGTTFILIHFLFVCLCITYFLCIFYVIYYVYYKCCENCPALFISYETKLRLAMFKRCTCHIKIRVMPMANFNGHVWDKRRIRYLKMGSGII